MLPITLAPADDATQCPVRDVLARVLGKWQALIVLALEDGPLRFGALKRTIGDISQRVLTQNLRSLERDSYLIRTVHAGPPVAVSYELTGAGRDLLAVIKPLVVWASDNHECVRTARKEFDARSSE